MSARQPADPGQNEKHAAEKRLENTGKDWGSAALKKTVHFKNLRKGGRARTNNVTDPKVS